MIRLTSERLRMSLSPRQGAAVTAFEARVGGTWQPVLAAPDGSASAPAALTGAMFVMVPFANRARDNTLAAGPVHHALRPNTAEPLALHGTGWERPWRVADAGPTHCGLTLSVGADYAFPFEAVFTVELDGDTARLALTVANPGESVIPAGLGFHPFFPRRADTLLRFGAATFWLEGPDHLPTDPVSIPAELDFSAGRPLPGSWRNNVYSGWDGRAAIVQPGLGYTCHLAASPALAELMLYTPPEADTFALEPQTHTSGATGRPPPPGATGLTALAPGRTIEARLTMAVSPHAPCAPDR